MKPAIHYEFIAKLIRRKKEEGEFEFLEVNEEFYNDNPILAREAAFKYYQNYIDVLLEAKGLHYESDKQAREVLESFYDPKTSTEVEFMGEISDFPESWGNGIAVFLVLDGQKDDTPLGNNRLIHGIGHLWEGSAEPESLTLHLEEEYNIYKDKCYSTGNYETSIIFCNSDEWSEGYRDNEPQTYTILKTPFDWTGMDKPYWWGEPEKETEEPRLSEDNIQRIIQEGEGNQVEFKEFFLSDKSGNKSKAKSKKKVADTICAFLNSRGGFLFIGVDDETNKPVGLIDDLKIANISNAKDYFKKQSDELIYQYLPEPIIDSITGSFIKVSGVEIFLIVIYPSKRNPIFIKSIEGLQFYYRLFVSTKEMKDMSKIANYCVEHWCKKTD